LGQELFKDNQKSESKLVIRGSAQKAIYSRAMGTYPEECCGLLIGSFDSSKGIRKVTRAKETANTFEESERYHRFTIDPKEFLIAEREAEEAGEEIVGVYHSHPNAPAKPSEFDRKHAWPGYSYLVIEVRGGQIADAKSWALSDDRERFIPEEMEIIG
jgi:proteasome lid subunit RPN8/RPN11